MYISSPPPSIVKVLIDVVVAGCANIFTKGFSHRVKTNPLLSLRVVMYPADYTAG